MKSKGKLCFIGDSHLAAVKEAWDNQDFRARYENWDIDFFGAIGSRLQGNLMREKNSIEPKTDSLRDQFIRTSGGKDRIAVHDYTGFAVFGPDLSIKPLLTYSSRNLVSEACLRAWVNDLARGAFAQWILREIMGCGMKSPCLVLAPLPGEGLFDGEAKASRVTAELVSGLYFRAHQELANVSGVRLIRQPPSTFSGVGATKRCYTLNPAFWLRQMTDHWHMNRSYGELVLAEVLQELNLVTG